LNVNIDVRIPTESSEAEEFYLAEWLTSVGQTVAPGQVIAELTTDKAIVEIEAPAAGTLIAQHAQVDQRMAPGDLLAVIEAD
jgi:pyruvate dehydrogenase E2 component (dihydrolipoamide acetyltransferase)